MKPQTKICKCPYGQGILTRRKVKYLEWKREADRILKQHDNAYGDSSKTKHP